MIHNSRERTDEKPSSNFAHMLTFSPADRPQVVGEHPEFPVERLALSRDRDLLASCSHDNRVSFWGVSYLFHDSGLDMVGAEGDSDDDGDEGDVGDDDDGATAAAAAAAGGGGHDAGDDGDDGDDDDDDDSDAMDTRGGRGGARKRRTKKTTFYDDM